MPRYIKFMQGSSEAYANLPRKDEDTLYQIDGKLYLGSQLIAPIEIEKYSVNTLEDVTLSNALTNESLLTYDTSNKIWKDKKISDLIFVGSTRSSAGLAGFVPAPREKDREAFLSGDGKWKKIEMPQTQETYSKDEIDRKVCAAAHLKRKMVNCVEDINRHSELYPDAEQYIYMVPTGFTLADNRYDEYMIIPVIDEDGVEIQAIERIGTWEVDLHNYVKIEEYQKLQQRVEALEKCVADLNTLIQGQTQLISNI